jgi:hypothetical protein
VLADAEGHIKRDGAGLIDRLALNPDRAVAMRRNEVPRPAPTAEPALLVGKLGIGKADLAVRGAANPDRDAG